MIGNIKFNDKVIDKFANHKERMDFYKNKIVNEVISYLMIFV
jgi:hypothetical protein